MIIGIDVGGTEIKAGIISKNKVIKKVKVRTGKKIVRNVIKAIEFLFDKRVKAIGIGFPGPADYEKGVWTLPPVMRLKEMDKDKYLAIGESDRMTLLFVKQ